MATPIMIFSHYQHQRNTIALSVFIFIAIALLNGIYVEALAKSRPFWFWIADGIHFLVVPGLAVLFLLKAASIRPCDYGFRSLGQGRSLFKMAGLTIFICVVFWITYVPVEWIAYRFLQPYAGTFRYGMLVPQAILPKLGVVIYFSGTAALVEEAAFRGLPWLYFSLIRPNRQPIAVYVLLSSLLFSAIHFEQGPHGMIATFFLGIVSALLYVKIQNLWPFVVGHFILDVASFW